MLNIFMFYVRFSANVIAKLEIHQSVKQLLYLAGILIWRYWQWKQKSPKYVSAKYSFEYSCRISSK